AATGLEVFYKAALAEGRRSTEVVGALAPTEALQSLLRGTGYVARATGPGAFTILQGPRPAAAAPDTSRIAYEPYFAKIQERITDLICRSANEAATSTELLFQVWLAPSGVVARAEVIGDDGSKAADQSFAAPMRGLAIGAPPTGLPQPITMVIFP